MEDYDQGASYDLPDVTPDIEPVITEQGSGVHDYEDGVSLPEGQGGMSQDDGMTYDDGSNYTGE